MSKYLALVEGGFYANALEVAHGVRVSNHTYAADVIGKDYYTVPDSLVNVTQTDIKKYYDDHKEAFKQGTSRDIEYVVFDVMPSDEDYAEAKRMVDDIAAEFARCSTLRSIPRPSPMPIITERTNSLPSWLRSLSETAARR